MMGDLDLSEGRSALIVEGEYLVGLHIQTILEAYGFTDATIVPGIREAKALLRSETAFDLAVVEIALDRPDTIDFARALRDAKTPLIGTTTDLRAHSGIAGLDSVPILPKPIPEESLADAVSAMFLPPDTP
ncbi:MAG: hypothetical protein BGO80_02935 [Devosia sp. 63-57]|nr:MAG: hypothetical protein ABS74_01390 [Pelagibacterium sp. SCN 63-126]OJX44534.1 MAG: hypothetical protein BGO80_02935 [Devosia sp. 63-57]